MKTESIYLPQNPTIIYYPERTLSIFYNLHSLPVIFFRDRFKGGKRAVRKTIRTVISTRR